MSDQTTSGEAMPPKEGIVTRLRRQYEEESPLVHELRRKFIVSSMLAVGLVVIALVAFVDIASWRQGVDVADSQLATLAEAGGSFEELLQARAMRLGPFGPSVPGGLGGPAQDNGFEPQLDEGARQEFPRGRRHGLGAGGQDGGSGQGDAEGAEGAGEDQGAGEDADGAEASADAPAKPSDAPQGRPTGARTFVGPRDRGLFGIDDLQDSIGFTDETPYQMRFFAVTLNGDGEVVSTDISRIALVDEEGAVSLAREVAERGAVKGSVQNYRYLVVDKGDGNTGYLFLDRSSDLIQLRSLVGASVGVAVAGLLAVLVLVVLFSGRVVGPVAESYKRQRRFITDASHDLKTPVAIISSDVDVIELTEGQSEWTDSIRHQVTRLTNLTDKLVMLSSMDEGTDAVTKVDFNLEATIEDAVREYGAPARVAGKRIKSDLEPRLTCHGDAVLIDQMLNLLLDNAVKYSSEGAEIRVSAFHERGKVAIRVSNPVDGMEPGDHGELFERFARADSSRTSSSGGNGIGLAVVKAIAEAHGGSASAKSKDGASLEFTVRV